MSLGRRLSALAAIASLVAAACSTPSSHVERPHAVVVQSEPAGEQARGESGERAGEEPGEEEGDADRIQRAGVAERTGSLRRATAPGWVGERIFGNGNDWEPATATDPGAPYVYLLTTRYSGRGPLPCDRCDMPAMALKVSGDGGATFGDVSYMPVDRSGGQYDPQIETDDAGDVFAAWINGGFRIVVSRSTDHGQTWSEPVVVSKPAGWADHPWIGVSPSGQHVCIAFNHAASWVTCSNDGGVTWPGAVQISTQERSFYANGDIVRDDGSVVVSNAGYKLHSGYHGNITVVVSRSADGVTWTNEVVDTVAEQPPCENRGCPHDHYGGQYALGSDADGDLVVAYDGAIRPLGAQYIWVRHSEDGGVTWSDRTRLSPRMPHIVASFTAAVGVGDGDFRVSWQDSRNGIRRWNTFVRRSTDGGLTWDPAVRISDAGGGRGYKHPAGYEADYGDFSEIDVTNTGRTVATWGEGFSYYGPGGTWFNLEA